MNILEQIVAQKRQDLPRLKEELPLPKRLRRQCSFTEILDALQHKRIIAEIKRASPSMGQIDMDVDFVQRARNYEAGNAAMISVLTDEHYFSGSFAFLREIGQEVHCPLLCKDFIIDEWQIDAAHSVGADAILLIVACLEEERLQELYSYALGKGLLPLVEIYGAAERYAAYQLRPLLLGVNSRNLETMEIDLEQGAATLSLLRRELSMPMSRAVRAGLNLPELPLLVGESGIFETHDARIWAEHGADCLLIGTSLMLAGKEPQTRGESADMSLVGKRISEFHAVFAAE